MRLAYAGFSREPGGDGPLDLYGWMVLAREFDRALCELNPRWFPCAGEEGVIVGSFVDLRPTDVAAPHYRDPFVVYLMRGADIGRLAAQVLGRPMGYNRGRSVPFTGPAEARVVPWVAGDLGTSLGVATGAALALRDEGSDGVCVCSFGDGTANRGDFHEALNLAASWKLPIVYVCQNNGWSISQRARDYLPASVYLRAKGYGIPGMPVDGQDVEAVRKTVGEAITRARRGEGPTLVEARTLRARGHWSGDDQTYRRLNEDSRPDPLELLAERLVANGEASAKDLSALVDEAVTLVAAGLKSASESRVVRSEDLGLEDVYA